MGLEGLNMTNGVDIDPDEALEMAKIVIRGLQTVIPQEPELALAAVLSAAALFMREQRKHASDESIFERANLVMRYVFENVETVKPN